MSDCYLTLEEVKLNTSYLDGSIYKTYITHFFSYTKARHEIRYLYDKNDNIHSVELYEIIDRKVDPDTNELFVRADSNLKMMKIWMLFFINPSTLKSQNGFMI